VARIERNGRAASINEPTRWRRRFGIAEKSTTERVGLAIFAMALANRVIAPASRRRHATAAATDGHGDRMKRWSMDEVCQGMPRCKQVPAGDISWHDATGWHLRVPCRTAGVAFSGTIRAQQQIHVTGYRTRDRRTVTGQRRRTARELRFVNHGRIEG